MFEGYFATKGASQIIVTSKTWLLAWNLRFQKYHKKRRSTERRALKTNGFFLNKSKFRSNKKWPNEIVFPNATKIKWTYNISIPRKNRQYLMVEQRYRRETYSYGRKRKWKRKWKRKSRYIYIQRCVSDSWLVVTVDRKQQKHSSLMFSFQSINDFIR